MPGIDPLGLALEHALRIKKAVDKWSSTKREEDASESKKDSKPGDGFKRRVKDFPGLMLSAGISPALLFYMAKADAAKLNAAYTLLSSETIDDTMLEKLVNKLDDELGGAEGSGYALMLASVIHAIEQLTGYKITNTNGELDHAAIARFIKKIRECTSIRCQNGVSEIQASMILYPYLVELRKLADAFFKEQKSKEKK